MSGKFASLIILCVGVVLCSAAEAQTASSEDVTMGGEYRRLNGHDFITPSNVLSAFTNTSVAFTQGFGSIALDLSGTDATLFLYGQQLLGQIGIANRVSLDLRAAGTAATGGDADTILTLGGLATLDASAMPKVRLVTSEAAGFQLSAGVGLSYSRQLRVLPLEGLASLIDDINNNQQLDFEHAGQATLQQADGIALEPALMIAEGYGPVSAQFSVSPQIPLGGDFNSFVVETGTLLTLDLHELPGHYVPVALTGEYALGIDFDEGTTTHTIAAGLHYSARRDFDVGLIGTMTLFPTVNDVGVTLMMGQMAMQYFF